MFNPDLLDDGERAAYDALLADIAFDDLGQPRRSAEQGPLFYARLTEIAEAGEFWANSLIRASAEAALQKRVHDWTKKQQFIRTAHGERLVKKSAVVGVQRRSAATGDIGWQLSFWESLTLDELLKVAAESDKRTAAEEITNATAKRLIGLCLRYGVEDVPTALDREGTTLDAFLAGAA